MMTTRWTNDMEVAFINLVAVQKNLWDVNDPLYLKKHLKQKTYQEISQKLTDRWPECWNLFIPESLISKFTNLRSYYRKERKKIRCKKKIIKVESKWNHFPRLKFLDESKSPVTVQFQDNTSENTVQCSINSMHLENQLTNIEDVQLTNIEDVQLTNIEDVQLINIEDVPVLTFDDYNDSETNKSNSNTILTPLPTKRKKLSNGKKFDFKKSIIAMHEQMELQTKALQEQTSVLQNIAMSLQSIAKSLQNR